VEVVEVVEVEVAEVVVVAEAVFRVDTQVLAAIARLIATFNKAKGLTTTIIARLITTHTTTGLQ